MSKVIQDRHATWLELFFDLIFVVAIAKAAHVLQYQHNGQISAITYLKYLLILIPVWWAWVGATLYANRFAGDDLVQRLLSFAQMFCVIILAAHINTDFDSYYEGFLFSYLAIRLLTIAMYVRASTKMPKTRHVSNYLALAFGAGALISLSSLLFDGVLRYVILYAGIGFDMLMPLLAKKRLRTVPVHAHHLPERFGLLTIILLGESILSLANSFDILSWSLFSILMAASGFVMACGLWVIYFDKLDKQITGKELGHGHRIIYSHLLIYAGLGGIAAMIRFAVVPELTLLDYKLLSGFGVFGFMFALQFLQFAFTKKSAQKRQLWIAIAFHLTFAALLVLAPSVAVILPGATLLILIYAVLDYRATRPKNQL
ncbi:Low temperature requirement protein A [hydrothermal vent metagenome]|uniref:Low temperature requirement protein A n=1 Tax=hydrothermal vent metagenome TaxID=652676 RepID=A0A3B0RSA6_9ZZZZ